MAINQFDEFVYNITNLLKQDANYPKYAQSITTGKNNYTISQVFTKKNFDSAWIATIEAAITALDTIVRNPRKFIAIEEEIVDISLARSISVESVKHLAQHTNLIASVKEDGMVIPNKILNTSKEESYEIYENRFIYTLILKTADFINRRFDVIKSALAQSGEIGVDIKSEFNLDGNRVSYNLGSSANFPYEEAVRRRNDKNLANVERIKRLQNVFNGFLSSAFGKEMKTCALVRPPIQRTNVILKDPNFKKALVLWQFVESSENMTFTIDTAAETNELNPQLSDRYQTLIFLNTMLMQSIAATRDTAGTESILNPDEVIADEYVTKNIDDFVPDDFPELKMDLKEVRRIYYKLPGEKTLKLTEISKMNAAIDRVLRQQKINKAKADSKEQKRLIEQQKKEELLAKQLALREARENERRKKYLEAERTRAEKRIEAERKRHERELKEEADRLAQEDAKQAAILAEIESQKRIEEEKRLAEERLNAERERLEKELNDAQIAHWEKERELKFTLLKKLDSARIKQEEQEILAYLGADEEKRKNELLRIHAALMSAMQSDYLGKTRATKNEVGTLIAAQYEGEKEKKMQANFEAVIDKVVSENEEDLTHAGIIKKALLKLRVHKK